MMRGTALFLGCGALFPSSVQGFTIPSRKLSGFSVRKGRAGSFSALADYPDGPRKDGVSTEIREVRDRVRQLIWKATDVVVQAVDDMPRMEHAKMLSDLGEKITEFDEKYFSKYRGVGATYNYLDSLSPKIREFVEQAGGEDEAEVRKEPLSESKEAGQSPLTPSAVAAMESSTASVVDEEPASIDDDSVSTSSQPGATSSTAGKAPATGAGVVRLDRPKQVQGVFDDLQKKAVQYYKQSPAAGASSITAAASPSNTVAPSSATVTALPASTSSPTLSGTAETSVTDSVEAVESELEDLLKESKYRPRALRKGSQEKLVKALEVLEESYPKDAMPLGDPSLPGEWSLVYSSSRNVIRRVLRGFLSLLVVVSDPSQTIEVRSSSVVNACRLRLRLTPLRWWRLSHKCTYRVSEVGGEAASRKVEVNFPKVKMPWWRKPFPHLNTEVVAGKMQIEVTHQSDRWRVCRAGGVKLAFRKKSP